MVQRSAGQLLLLIWLTGGHPVEIDGRRLRPQPANYFQEEEEKGEEAAEERGYATNGQKEKEVSLCRGHHQKQACV